MGHGQSDQITVWKMDSGLRRSDDGGAADEVGMVTILVIPDSFRKAQLRALVSKGTASLGKQSEATSLGK
jgi:hypothetical protein